MNSKLGALVIMLLLSGNGAGNGITNSNNSSFLNRVEISKKGDKTGNGFANSSTGSTGIALGGVGVRGGKTSQKGDKTGNGFENGGDGVRPFTKTENALAGGSRVGGRHQA